MNLLIRKSVNQNQEKTNDTNRMQNLHFMIGKLVISTLLIFVTSTSIKASTFDNCNPIPLETINGIDSIFDDSEINEIKQLIYKFDSVVFTSPMQNYDQAYMSLLVSIFFHLANYDSFNWDDIMPRFDEVYNHIDSFDETPYSKLFIKRERLNDTSKVTRYYITSTNFGGYSDLVTIIASKYPDLLWYLDFLQQAGDCMGVVDCLYTFRNLNYHDEGVRLIFAVYFIVWHNIDNQL